MKRTHYASLIVKRNTGLGPKPRLKKQVKPCIGAQIPQTSPVTFSGETLNAATKTEEDSTKDQLEEPVNGESRGRGNESLNEIEPEECNQAVCELRQENGCDSINNDSLHCDGKEFVRTVLEHEDDVGNESVREIESEDYDQGVFERGQENDSGSISKYDLHHDRKGFIDKVLDHEDDMESRNEPLRETESEEYDETGRESGKENDCGLINEDDLNHDGNESIDTTIQHEDDVELGDEPLEEIDSEEFDEAGCESGQENDSDLINEFGQHPDGQEFTDMEYDVKLGKEALEEIETEEYDQAGYESGKNDSVFINKDGLHHNGKESALQNETGLEIKPDENNVGHSNKADREGYSVDGFQENKDEAGRMADELDVKKPDKTKIPELFVGGLDKNVTEDDIRKSFSKVGEVVNIKMMINPVTNKNQGYAFLQYATMEQAIQALTELKNPVVNCKQWCVAPCKENKATLFLSNICTRWTEQRLIETLKSIGIKELKDLRLARDFSHNFGRDNCGFSFLEFLSHSDAMTAYKRLQERDIDLGGDQPAKICFTDPDIQLREETIAKVRGVFLNDVPSSLDTADVKELVRKYGNIEKIELACVHDKPLAKRRSCGFVMFYSHDAAVACAKAINNAGLKNGHHKVKTKASLSEPSEELDWKHLLCRNFQVEKEPNSRDVKYSTNVRTSKKLNRSTKSSCCGYKIESGDRNKTHFSPKSRSRPLPHAERSYKRKSSASVYHERCHPVKKHYAANRYDSSPRKRHYSTCGSHGMSDSRGYPLHRHGGSKDSCSCPYPQTRRNFDYESCSCSSLRSPGSEPQNYCYTNRKSGYRDCYLDNADNRMFSSSNRSDYKSSVHGSSHPSIFSRLQSGGSGRPREGFTTEYPGSLSNNYGSISGKPVVQDCCLRSNDDTMHTCDHERDHMSYASVDSRSVFNRLGPDGMSRQREGFTHGML